MGNQNAGVMVEFVEITLRHCHPAMRSLTWSNGMKTEAEIRQAGMRALVQALGAVDAERFVAALMRDRFDYTEGRKTGLPDLDLETLSAQAALFQYPGSLNGRINWRLEAPGERIMKFELDLGAEAVYLELTAAEAEGSREIQPGIIMDYDAEGRIVGIEVPSVSNPGE